MGTNGTVGTMTRALSMGTQGTVGTNNTVAHPLELTALWALGAPWALSMGTKHCGH
jgi:hypothetical protein